jgi:hypothetical protein
MDVQKINFKIFVAEPDGVPMSAFIPIFHSWIQATDGDFHDVADYSHMHAGPGVLLLAHEANISIDQTGNRLGLLYNRKQALSGTTLEKLRTVLASTLETCCRIETEPSLQGKFKFLGGEMLFMINDRLLSPNTEETFQAVRSDLDALAKNVYGEADFALEPDLDSRQRFAVRIAAGSRFDVGTLLKNLGAARTN